MNDHSTPDDDLHEVVELDGAWSERVRAALREVPPQDPAMAAQARDAALRHVAGPRRRRQPAWLAMAAAGVVAVLGVAVLGRSESGESNTAVPPARVVEELEGRLEAAAADTRAAAASPMMSPDADLNEIAVWVDTRSPVDDARCPLVEDERSYGVRLWSGAEVEVLVDAERRTFRLVDLAACGTLVAGSLNP